MGESFDKADPEADELEEVESPCVDEVPEKPSVGEIQVCLQFAKLTVRLTIFKRSIYLIIIPIYQLFINRVFES